MNAHSSLSQFVWPRTIRPPGIVRAIFVAKVGSPSTIAPLVLRRTRRKADGNERQIARSAADSFRSSNLYTPSSASSDHFTPASLAHRSGPRFAPRGAEVQADASRRADVDTQRPRSGKLDVWRPGGTSDTCLVPGSSSLYLLRLSWCGAAGRRLHVDH